MNIINRLKRLEKSSNSNSDVCICKGDQPTIVVLEPSWDQTEQEHQQLLAEAERPELCDHCRKPIEKQLIIIEGIEGEIPKPN